MIHWTKWKLWCVVLSLGLLGYGVHLRQSHLPPTLEALLIDEFLKMAHLLTFHTQTMVHAELDAELRPLRESIQQNWQFIREELTLQTTLLTTIQRLQQASLSPEMVERVQLATRLDRLTHTSQTLQQRLEALEQLVNPKPPATASPAK